MKNLIAEFKKAIREENKKIDFNTNLIFENKIDEKCKKEIREKIRLSHVLISSFQSEIKKIK